MKNFKLIHILKKLVYCFYFSFINNLILVVYNYEIWLWFKPFILEKVLFNLIKYHILPLDGNNGSKTKEVLRSMSDYG